MPLKEKAALSKDNRAAPARFEHRHFATIAAFIRDMPKLADETPEQRAYGVTVHEAFAKYMASQLALTNPKFNKERFIRACGIE